MTWLDDFPKERNERRNVAWHHAGLTFGKWIDWLIDRGDIITTPEHERRVATLLQTIRFEREQHERDRTAIGSNLDATARENAAVVHRVRQLVDVRRKTLRMDDLMTALGWDD